MCGIIGAAGNLLALDKLIFTELLHADVVRGKHATGMIQVKGQCRAVNNFKLAYPAPLFLELPSVQQELEGFLANTVAVGHNRHATKGASGEHKNAHPFQHGHISMVHNGSLTSWHDLTPTGETYTVDSEAICRALELDGPEVVIPKLRGDFALVWVNSETNTLNFIRNSRRPLAIAMNHATDKMWWASELDMLNWSLNRDTFTRTPVSYGEMFELPVGQLLTIPITHSGIDLKERTMASIDVSDSVYSYSRYQRPVWDPLRKRNLRGNETLLKAPPAKSLETLAVTKDPEETVTPYRFGASREDAMEQLTGKLIVERGKDNLILREFISSIDTDLDACVLDNRIGMFITSWSQYASTAVLTGSMEGVMMEYPYCKIKIHGITKEEYTACITRSSGSITSYLSGFVVPTDVSLVDMDKEKFTILLRKDQIRRADLNDFQWTMEKVPPEVSICETKTATLKDNTQVSVGDTAVYLGKTTQDMFSNMRYKIYKIETIDKILHLYTKVGSTEHQVPWVLWGQGILSAESEVLKKQADKYSDILVVGPDSKEMKWQQWIDLVDVGCVHCNEPMNDHTKASSLVWFHDSTYMCEVCEFSILNIGY